MHFLAIRLRMGTFEFRCRSFRCSTGDQITHSFHSGRLIMKLPNSSVVRRLWELGGVAAIIVASLAIRAALGDDASEPKEATATLRVGSPRPLEGNAPRDANFYEQYRRTQVQLLRSDLVLGGALHEEGILDLPALQAAKGAPK